ncbi:hypothetical protein J6590_010378 [Homalodisca vitripennis]|nr:hypothetical protein J6590_010378 [Homalodisca vitripennis]
MADDDASLSDIGLDYWNPSIILHLIPLKPPLDSCSPSKTSANDEVQRQLDSCSQ